MNTRRTSTKNSIQIITPKSRSRTANKKHTNGTNNRLSCSVSPYQSEVCIVKEINKFSRYPNLTLPTHLKSRRNSISPSKNYASITINLDSESSIEEITLSPKRNLKSEFTNASESLPPEQFFCPICYDTKSEIKEKKNQLMSTICGHVFCCKCLKQAVKCQGYCPTCRKKLNCKQIHPIWL